MPYCFLRRTVPAATAIAVLFLILLPPVLSCGPGRGGNRRRSPRKLTPLVFKQHVPNVSENTISAAGFREGKVTRHDSRFKDLVPNYNPDVIFKDEEGTGADRLMTRRLKEKLNTLAISVMNQWPGVRLRVTEGWDEESHHASDSLHYEGRAVDITTSDRDRSKYGMLARLAVEAGFDWVYYESRYHIHCSVKSEKSDAARNGGCFNSDSYVTTPGGPVPIRDIAVGDEVLAVDSSGQPVFSPVLLFMDRDASATRVYYKISTESGKTITMTGSHLIFVMDGLEQDFNSTVSNQRVLFARQVIPQQFVLSAAKDGVMSVERVTDVRVEELRGAFAPLTREGNLVVNDVLASCYANIRHQWLAHASFFPVRSYSNFIDSWNHLFPPSRRRKRQQETSDQSPGTTGIHWYPRFLLSIASRILPANYFD